MPIEIKELHIKIHVGEEAVDPVGKPKNGSSKEASVSAETIEEVMEIQRLQKER